MIRRLFYFFLRALRNMRQTPVLCAAAVGTVTVALTLVTLFAVLVVNVQNVARDISREIQIVIYLDQAPVESQLSNWLTALRAEREVEKVVYISASEALSRFRQRLGSDAGLVDGVEVGVLPASLEITLREEFRKHSAILPLVERIKSFTGLRDVRYGSDWIDKFEAVLSLLRTVGLAVGAFLLSATLFIVSNTIRLTLFSRRDEIEIMSLVGATPLFIQLPFLIEGIVQGGVGGGLALAIGFGMYQFGMQQGLSDLLAAVGVEQVIFLPWGGQLLLVATGIALGLVGSLLALRRLGRE